MTPLYMHMLKLSDIVLHTAFNVSLFSRVYWYWLVFALRHYSIAGLILLIIMRGHMPGFGKPVVLWRQYFWNFHVYIDFMLKVTLETNRKKWQH